MVLDQIIPAIFLIAVLILILPSFLKTNKTSKQIFLNLLFWSVIIVTVVIISYLILI